MDLRKFGLETSDTAALRKVKKTSNFSFVSFAT